MTDILCLAHRKDVDGLASHAILRRYALINGYSIKHFFVNYGDFNDAIREISDYVGKLIVVADIGYNKNFMEVSEILKKLAEKNEFLWIDHHDWSDSKLNTDIKFIIDMKYCAAELVYRTFMKDDEVSKELAYLARTHDFRLKNERSELADKIYEVISSGFDKEKIVDYLSKGIFWNEEFENAYIKYQKAKEKGFKFLDEHVKVYKNRYKFVLALSKDYLSSTIATSYLLEKYDVDFVVCLWKNGKMSFRRKNKKINLKEIAKNFNGGGREEAAGAKIDITINEDNFEEIFDKISEKIKNILETIKVLNAKDKE